MEVLAWEHRRVSSFNGESSITLRCIKILEMPNLLFSHVDDHLKWHLWKHLIESQLYADILQRDIS